MADDIDEIEDDSEEVSKKAKAADAVEDRLKDYSSFKYVQEQLADVWQAVDSAYADKTEQNSIVEENWDIYHCVLNEHQTYTGSSQVYVPIVKDAMKARCTRFVNMLFPNNRRYAEIIGQDGSTPVDLTALMDNYIKRSKMRSKVVPAMVRNGDIGGQYSLYVEWLETDRCVTSRTTQPDNDEGIAIEGGDEYEDMEYEEITDARPDVTVLDARDYVILPTTVDDIEEAEIVAVTQRFTPKRIKEFVRRGIFDAEAAKQLQARLSNYDSRRRDPAKEQAQAAGIRLDSSGNKIAYVQEVYTKLKIRGKMRRMRIYFGGDQLILSCKRNPYWCDRIPVIHQPIEKNTGSIWGPTPINTGIRMLQYQANDYANMGFDSGMYSMLPIVMTDPDKNPRAGTMVLNMASVWLVDPNSTKFAEFPPLWQHAFAIIQSATDQIFRSLSVNPAMVPQGNAGKNPTQAQIAQEQQVAIESASDETALIAEGVLAEVLQWFYELDYQFRTEETTVKKYGTLGMQATMDRVPLFATRERYEFNWYGTEGFKAAQQVQQQISWLNVLRGIGQDPSMLNGRKLDLAPVIEAINATIIGPRMAPHVIIDQRHQMTIAPDFENEMLMHEFPIQVHEMDNDEEHIRAHLAYFKQALDMPPEMTETNNMIRLVKGHIMEHMKAMKAKAIMAMGAQQGQVGGPGQPRLGAQAQPPTGVQNPPGAVGGDEMPLSMPRKL